MMPESCLLLGDFNGHNPLWGSRHLSPRGRIIESGLNRHSLVTMNDGTPTFFSRGHRTTSAIDLSISSARVAPLFEWTVASDPLFSDHYPIHLLLATPHHIPSMPTIKKFETKNADWAMFNTNVNRHAPYDISLTINDFTKAILESAEETFKEKNISVGNSNRPQNAVWWNWKCQRAKALRKRAFRNFQKCICDVHAHLYSEARKECDKIIFEEKKEAWQSYAAKCNRFTPLGDIWKQVRSFASRRIPLGAFPQLHSNGQFITDPNAVTNALAKHFADASSTVIYSPSVHRSLTYQANSLDFSSCNTEAYNTPFTMRELKLSLAKASTKTSVGPDRLPYSFYTNLNERNLSALLIAFNNLWINDSFPNEWLKSIIIPILKPGKDKENADSYRPISLTNCICKVFERMVNTRLRYYLERNHCIDACQSGFRENHSTTDNVLRLITDIQINWERRQPTVAVFLDLVSAFNKVHSSTVLTKLHSIGIRGHMASFLRNFLKPRTFQVRCQSTLSDNFVLEHGVPQGSVLSPTLFLIALNDILLSLPRVLTFSVRYSLFADDVAIWVSHKDYKRAFIIMQMVLDHCTSWCAKWGFFLSAPKSAMMVFKRGPPPLLERTPRINGNRIPYRKTHKFLGIILDTNLTFRTHVEHIRARCTKRINVLRCVSGFSWGADRKTLQVLYVGLIRSTIEYNCYLFSTLSPTLCRRLEAIQSICLRLITGAFRTSPVLALRADTGIPALEDRRMFLFLRYYYRAKSIANHIAVPAMEAKKPATRRPLRKSCFLPDLLKQGHEVLDIVPTQIAPTPPQNPLLDLKRPIC